MSAAQTLEALLAPPRFNRLEAQHAADTSVPFPGPLADLWLNRTLAQSGSEVGRRIATTTVLALARVQRAPALSPAVALQLSERLPRLTEQLQSRSAPTDQLEWSRGLASLLKDREALDQALGDPARLPHVAPGMPIGMDEEL